MAVTEFGANELVTRSNVNQRISQINANFPVSVANGGTGQTSLTSGNILLGNGTSGITSTSTLPVSKGGTGATTVAAARTNLGIEYPVSVANGGTGAISSGAAIENLGMVDDDGFSASANDFDSWAALVLDHVNTELSNKQDRPFVFHARWTNHGSGVGFAQYSYDTGIKFVTLFYDEIGVKYYYKKSSNAWQETTVGNLGITLPLSIANGGTGSSNANYARVRLGITESLTHDFQANSYADWVSAVQSYVDTELSTERRPLFFHAGWAGVGSGCGIAWQSFINNDSGFKFLILFNQYDEAGVKYYCKEPGVSATWQEVSSSRGRILYNDSTGANDNITLTDSVANYDYVDITYRDSGPDGESYNYHTVRLYSPSSRNTSLTAITVGSPSINVYNCLLYFSGAWCGKIANHNKNFAVQSSSGTINTWSGDDIYITQIRGYKI